MPTTASADRASAALEELAEALKNPAAAKPFLNTGNKLNAAIEALTEILATNRSTRPPNSEASPPRVYKRTTTVRTPRVNTAQAGSGSPLVTNDPKLPFPRKITLQSTMRGLNEITSMRADPTLNATNNINKMTSIPTKFVKNNNNITDNNNINNNINEVNSEVNSEENSPRR
jgi:hypothetical protein